MKNLETIIKVLEWFLVWAVLFVGTYQFGYMKGKGDAGTTIETRVDTLTNVDTIHVPEPFEVARRVVDTFYVPVSDTVQLRDSFYIMLPKIQREYEDSMYHAWVSGYMPHLDSIDVFRTEITITKEVPVTTRPKRWNIGPQLGCGVSARGVTPYVGIGVTYGLFQF